MASPSSESTRRSSTRRCTSGSSSSPTKAPPPSRSSNCSRRLPSRPQSSCPSCSGSLHVRARPASKRCCAKTSDRGSRALQDATWAEGKMKAVASPATAASYWNLKWYIPSSASPSASTLTSALPPASCRERSKRQPSCWSAMRLRTSGVILGAAGPSSATAAAATSALVASSSNGSEEEEEAEPVMREAKLLGLAVSGVSGRP
mmetsp:Transcript_67362/g.186706  ORF Transcript_67362/g.186706 Transcript_67362/m.186706 type:complete len:204 (-) Transcript_67362:306-917(-)